MTTINELVAESYETAFNHGWWQDTNPNIPEKIALMHSELSEALEEIRNGKPPTMLYFSSYTDGKRDAVDHTYRDNQEGSPYKPEGFPSELADVMIRIADLCGYLGIDLQAAVTAKLAYNKTRPFRHGGKTC